MSRPVTKWIKLGVVLVVGVVLVGCRGMTSEKPPIHLNPNMDNQKRHDPQEGNEFFSDKRAMRPLVKGTVAFGHLEDDDHLYRGKVGSEFAATMPMDPADPAGKGRPMLIAHPKGNADLQRNKALLARGEERYRIYCTPCHDDAGTGKGIVTVRGIEFAKQAKKTFPAPPSFHDATVRSMPIGRLYNVITNGARQMPPYKTQIPVRDRWAIAAYVRVLQISGRTGLEQIPAERAAEERWEIR
jgi:mono/diheme cytochrome c family protein